MSKAIRMMDVRANYIEGSGGNLDTREYKTKKGKIKKRKLRSIYNSSLDDSLYVRKLDALSKEMTGESIFKISNEDKKSFRYTDVLVSVDFSDDYSEASDETYNPLVMNHKTKKLEIVADRKKHKTKCKPITLRRKYYKKAFTLNGETYVMDKRSASMARDGGHLFIKKEFLDTMRKWSRLGVELKRKVDIAAVRAYESLTLSGIKDTITIHPHQILLISDVKDTFKSPAHVTTICNGIVDAQLDVDWMETSDLFDGQSLMDSSMFPKDENGYSKGAMLLRGKWFKSAAFNTNIQQFFAERHKKDKIVDMCGRELNTADIRLICTPNSLKFLKMYDEDERGLSDQFNSTRECYEHWLKDLESEGGVFGIVKSESRSRFGDRQQLSYQMLQTLPFTFDGLRELCSEEVKFVGDIRNDIDAFLKYVGSTDEKEDKTFIDLIMALDRDKAIKTDEYRTFRKNIIGDYVLELRKGKIKLFDTDYSWVVGNPYEMLQLSIQQDKDLDERKFYQPLKKWEIYQYGKIPKTELVIFRNPHVCGGNVIVGMNKFDKVFKEYFNLNRNIVVVNAIGVGIQSRAQGVDYDSDNCIVCPDSRILPKAKWCMDNFPTPVKDVPNDPRILPMTPKNMADIDDIIANNLIGRIINKSQEFNSYYWHEYNHEKRQEILDECYRVVSILSSLSQIEIDKAKKFYDTLKETKDFLEELNLNGCIRNPVKRMLRNKHIETEDINWVKEHGISEEELYLNLKECQKVFNKEYKHSISPDKNKKALVLTAEEAELMKTYSRFFTSKDLSVRPAFFNALTKSNYADKFSYQQFDCPMDWLQEIIVGIDRKKHRGENSISIIELLTCGKRDNNQYKKIDEINEWLTEYDNGVSQAHTGNKYTTDKERLAELKEEFFIKLAAKKMNVDSVYTVITNCFDDKLWGDNSISKRSRMFLLKALTKTHTELVYEVFGVQYNVQSDEQSQYNGAA